MTHQHPPGRGDIVSAPLSVPATLRHPVPDPGWRALYSALLYVATPFALARLWWKGRLVPGYRQRVGERFGYVPSAPQGVTVWLHAVSVGEAIAAGPLVKALVARHGAGQVWVTSTTPTGSAQVRRMFGESVRHSYAPYDLPAVVERFLRRVRPRVVVVMETELWPNLFAAVRRKGIPMAVVNARLSPRSFRGYGRVGRFAASVLADTSFIAAQTADDMARFVALGAPRVVNAGNIEI